MFKSRKGADLFGGSGGRSGQRAALVWRTEAADEWNSALCKETF